MNTEDYCRCPGCGTCNAGKQRDKLKTRIAALEAENAALKADAERYRWLKKEQMVFFWNDDYKPPYTTIRAWGDRTADGHFLSLESAIDAARSKT